MISCGCEVGKIQGRGYNTFRGFAHMMLGYLSISGDGLTRTIPLLITVLVAMQVKSAKEMG